MIGLWDRYWAWTGGNIGAMPLQSAIVAVAGLLAALVLRPLWRRALAWLKAVEEAAAAAAAAHRITADLFEHHTGRAHPDAPGKESGME